MKYKLIKPINPNYSVVEQILTNRGIKYEQIKHYLNTTDEDINEPELLGEDKLKTAAGILINTVRNEENVYIIVD